MQFISQVNYVVDYLNLEVKMIDQMILKVENIFKHNYNQQYNQSNQSNIITSDTINNTIKTMELKAI